MQALHIKGRQICCYCVCTNTSLRADPTHAIPDTISNQFVSLTVDSSSDFYIKKNSNSKITVTLLIISTDNGPFIVAIGFYY